MMLDKRKSRFLYDCRMGLSALALGQFSLGPAFAGGAPGPADNNTQTPIKHLIVIIGENRSFDHVFATYVPQPGQSINNLLSEGIITLDANKNAVSGPNFQSAHPRLLIGLRVWRALDVPARRVKMVERLGTRY
jgi:phospholipase C